MQQNKEQDIQKFKEAEQYWGQFSVLYNQLFGECLSPVSISLLNMVKIENSNDILEIATGPGYYVPHLLQRKNPKANLVLTDLSGQILGITSQRIQKFLENPIQGPYQQIDYQNIENISKTKKFENINTKLQLANSEDLDFNDCSFDTYLCSLCLQITPNPQTMLKECFRVLKPGGKTAMSVWGKKENSLIWTILPQIFKEEGIEMPQNRSNFHLNDENQLKQMFEQAGFTDIQIWGQFMPMNLITCEEEVENFLKIPKLANMVENLVETEDKRKIIKLKIFQKIRDFLKQNKNIGFDTISIFARKPIN